MRKLLLVLVGVVALLGFFVPPASADIINTSPFACTQKSGIGYNVQVCSQFSWRFQNDGTGVHFEAVRLEAQNDCGDLNNKAFDGVLFTTDKGGRAIGDQYTCDVWWNVEANGPDVGMATAQMHANVNVAGAPDFTVNLFCEVHPSDYTYNCWGNHS